MQKLIQFYTAYGGYLDGYFTFTFMAMLVMLGISVMNEFNDKNEIWRSTGWFCRLDCDLL